MNLIEDRSPGQKGRTLRGAAVRVSLGIVLIPLFLTGCKIGPNFTPMPPKVETIWREVGQGAFTGTANDKADWWKKLNDPVLNSLMDQAFKHNLTLQTASLRIVEARIGKSVAGQFLYPLVTAGAGAVHVDFSETTKPDVNVTLPDVNVKLPSLPGPGLPQFITVKEKPSVTLNPKLDTYSASIDALWELDLWGGTRRRIESKSAGIIAAYAGYDDVMVSVAGEVAANYIQTRVLDQRLATMKQNVEVLKSFQALAEERYARKESPETDVQLAKTLVAIVEVGVPKLENALRQTENALCVLLGKMPQDLRAELGASGAIPVVDSRIAVGIPPDLLRRRPDVRMAEALAHAQCARIGIAKARILPSFSLIGSLGLKTTDIQQFFDKKSFAGAYGAIANANGFILYPFTIELVRAEDAQFEEAMLQYQSTVFNAAREVENSMTAVLKAKDEIRILTEGSKAAVRSAELAVGAYKAGKVIVSVPLVALTFQANLQDQLIASQGSSVTNLVATYKALGGGWESREGQELVPEEIRERMKDRTDWWSFFGKSDLRTGSGEKAKKN